MEAINQVREEAKNSQLATSEIAVAAQKQNASLEEIATPTDTLADMAEKLQGAVRKFKI